MSSAAKQLEKIEGVVLSAVKEEVVDKFLAKFGLAKTGSLKTKVERLAVHIRRLTPDPEENLVECNTCEGPSCAGQGEPVSTDVCPFCGDGDDDAPPAVAEPPKVGDAEPKTEVVGKVKTIGKGANVKPVATALATRNDRVAAARAAAPVPFEKLMVEFRAARAQTVEGYWKVGDIIGKMISQKAYLEVRDEKGRPKYSTFDQFCAGELKMTPQNAWRLARVASVFDAPTVDRLGTCKLDLLLKVSDADQQKMLVERAEKGATISELQEEILRRTDKKPKADKGDKPSTAKAAPAGITATFALGRQRLKLWTRGKEDKRARTLADDPWCLWELPNGVQIRIVVAKNAKGELELATETRKV